MTTKYEQTKMISRGILFTVVPNMPLQVKSTQLIVTRRSFDILLLAVLYKLSCCPTSSQLVTKITYYTFALPWLALPLTTPTFMVMPTQHAPSIPAHSTFTHPFTDTQEFVGIILGASKCLPTTWRLSHFLQHSSCSAGKEVGFLSSSVTKCSSRPR